MDDTRRAEQRTVIHLECDIDGSLFEVHIENANPIQLWGAAEFLRRHGTKAATEMEMRQYAAQSPIITPDSNGRLS